MTKQKVKIPFQRLTKLPVLTMIAVFAIGFAAVPLVQADRYEDQIRALNQQNNQTRAQQAELQVQATSIQAVIAELQSQIVTLEGQIQASEEEQLAVQQKIIEAEVKLLRQQELLGTNIRTMYLEGELTTMEMLATSSNLSEYIDKKQYREAVNRKIKDTFDKITLLKAELRDQKAKVDKLIADQKLMQTKLAEQRAENDRLLGLNYSQQAAYESEIKANLSKISGLRREQAATNARLFGSGIRNVPDTSGYPWANYRPFPNSVSDLWGMYLRQCVSYTAWKVWKSGRHMPFWGGIGNANMWDENAIRAGIPTDGNPRVGDVAISNAGYYGHSMYVEHVYEDGRILISQYNVSWDGNYSEAIIWPGSLVFIHFP